MADETKKYLDGDGLITYTQHLKTNLDARYVLTDQGITNEEIDDILNEVWNISTDVQIQEIADLLGGDA